MNLSLDLEHQHQPPNPISSIHNHESHSLLDSNLQPPQPPIQHLQEKSQLPNPQFSDYHHPSIDKSHPVKKPNPNPDHNLAAPALKTSATKEEILASVGIAPHDFDSYLQHVASSLKHKTLGAALTAIANNPARAKLEYQEWKQHSCASISTLAYLPMSEMPYTSHSSMRQAFHNPRLSRERFLRLDYAAKWLEWAQLHHPEWLHTS